MKNLLKITGIAIALTAIGVAVKANDKNKNYGSVINAKLTDLPVKEITSLRQQQLEQQ